MKIRKNHGRGERPSLTSPSQASDNINKPHSAKKGNFPSQRDTSKAPNDQLGNIVITECFKITLLFHREMMLGTLRLQTLQLRAILLYTLFQVQRMTEECRTSHQLLWPHACAAKIVSWRFSSGGSKVSLVRLCHQMTKHSTQFVFPLTSTHIFLISNYHLPKQI